MTTNVLKGQAILLPSLDEPMRGWAVTVCEPEKGNFRVLCCGRILFDVQEAAAGLWSYHLRHAWGGMGFTCRDCRHTYVLSGTMLGVGSPDVVDLARLDHSRLRPLTALQTHLLDVALERDEACWLRSMDDLKASVAAEGEVARHGRWHAAILIRARLQWAKQLTLDLIAREHGFDGAPSGARIFRVPDTGQAYIQLPVQRPATIGGEE